MEAFRVPVRHMSGEVVVLEAMPTTTIQEFKQQLEGCNPCDDELARKMSTADLIVGGEKLLENYKRLDGRIVKLQWLYTYSNFWFGLMLDFVFIRSVRGHWLSVAFQLMRWWMFCIASIASSAAPKKPLAVRLKTCGSWTFQREWLRLEDMLLKAALLWQVFPFLILWPVLKKWLSHAAVRW